LSQHSLIFDGAAQIKRVIYRAPSQTPGSFFSKTQSKKAQQIILARSFEGVYLLLFMKKLSNDGGGLGARFTRNQMAMGQKRWCCAGALPHTYTP
jgi:hypothetical protein